MKTLSDFISNLESDNAALKAENETSKQRIAELEAENKLLEKQVQIAGRKLAGLSGGRNRRIEETLRFQAEAGLKGERE